MLRIRSYLTRPQVNSGVTPRPPNHFVVAGQGARYLRSVVGDESVLLRGSAQEHTLITDDGSEVPCALPRDHKMVRWTRRNARVNLRPSQIRANAQHSHSLIRPSGSTIVRLPLRDAGVGKCGSAHRSANMPTRGHWPPCGEASEA